MKVISLIVSALICSTWAQNIKTVPWTEEDFEGSLHKMKFPKVVKELPDSELILSGELRLASIRCEPDACSSEICDCIGIFCKIDDNVDYESSCFVNQAVLDSEICHATQISRSLNEVYEDIMNSNSTKNLSVELVVFDMGGTDAEDRVGREIVNSVAKKVVSDVQPLVAAMTMCDKMRNVLMRQIGCTKSAVQDLVDKVSKLLCLTDVDAEEDGCILLMNSDASASYQYLPTSMEQNSVAYVYGPPELVVTDDGTPLDSAPCNKYYHRKPQSVEQIASDHGMSPQDLSLAQNCAANLALNMGTILNALSQKENGYIMNVLDGPSVVDTLITNVYGAISRKQTNSVMPGIGWMSDEILAKKGKSNPEMSAAADAFVSGLYSELQDIRLQDNSEKTN